jgi:hypothetical protein
MQRYEFELFADYHQFYLQDEAADADVSFESWSDEAIENGAVLMPGKIFVQTVRNMDVPVIIEVQDSAPDNNFDEWDKVFECSIDIPSGKIVIAGCTDEWDEADRIEVVPGVYRARIYHGDLDTLNDDGLDGDDHYKVILWPAAPQAEAMRLK